MQRETYANDSIRNDDAGVVVVAPNTTSTNLLPPKRRRWITKGRRKSFSLGSSGMISCLTRMSSHTMSDTSDQHMPNILTRSNSMASPTAVDRVASTQERHDDDDDGRFKDTTPKEEGSLVIEATSSPQQLDSKSIMLAKISDSPTSSSSELAKEYIDECLIGRVGGTTAVDPTTWERIPQYSKSDFLIGKHLGHGSFSDVYEISLVALENNESSPSSTKNLEAFAMKCLRPKIQSDTKQFIVGVEDLVHETAKLASLDHPNIIKLHGRASTDSPLSLGDDYFILLDRLQDSLDDRIVSWKKISDTNNGGYGGRASSRSRSLSISQLRVAHSIADALSYLHHRKIVFLDLKPSNVGFDSMGVVKLFDFGFAIDMNSDPSNTSSQEQQQEEEEGGGEGRSHCHKTNHLLHNICGTPRYMAPEVGLELGYGFPADVHSFGILLWEICSLKKPFERVTTAAEFHKSVFQKGARPSVRKCWPQALQDMMCSCWSRVPGDRPTMEFVKMILGDAVSGK